MFGIMFNELTDGFTSPVDAVMASKYKQVFAIRRHFTTELLVRLASESFIKQKLCVLCAFSVQPFRALCGKMPPDGFENRHATINQTAYQ